MTEQSDGECQARIDRNQHIFSFCATVVTLLLVVAVSMTAVQQHTAYMESQPFYCLTAPAETAPPEETP